MGSRGIVAKNPKSIYEPGKCSGAWQKHQRDALIGRRPEGDV
jgi:ATP-dependent DNA ligase